MKHLVFDIETDGFNPTKIHVLSCCYLNSSKEWCIKSTTSYDDMRKFFETEGALFIGHNIIRFDLTFAFKILNIKSLHHTSRVADTLPLSQYYYHSRKEHNLESWGETIGIPKKQIDDWENLPVEEYIERCEEDVKISTNVWVRLYKALYALYGREEEMFNFIEYISDKYRAAAIAEKSRWKLNVDLCKKNLVILENELAEKVSELKIAMPPIPVKKVIKKPSTMYTKSNKLSKAGESWINLLKELDYDLEYSEDIEVTSSFKEPNPQSADQRKDWLFSLGWKPITFRYIDNGDGSTKREIPLIIKPNKELCESVIELAEKHKEVLLLEKVGSLVQRIAMLRKWIETVSEDGYMVAGIAGITNTLRFIHSGLVNIPKVSSSYGEYIRSCLCADEGYELCGSDMVSLETLTKLHYIRPYDPRYVSEELTANYDAHLTLAIYAEKITKDDEIFYKKYKSSKGASFSQEDKERYDSIDKIRTVFKTCNYALTYNSGAENLARASHITLKEAKAIKQAYWKRNWAVKKIASCQNIKKVEDNIWAQNPVSMFWHSLRSEKDVFSTINSSTGVYCFDLWIKNILKVRPQINGQFHDEGVFQIRKGYRNEMKAILIEAIDKVNKEVKLNVPLSISVEFGDTYADVH